MRNVFSRLGSRAAMMVGLLAPTAVAAADPATPVVAATDKTDWSKFAPVNTITAEVRQVDAGSVTLRVYWMAAGAGPNGSGKTNTNNNNYNRNRRPSLSGNHGRGHTNPLQQMMQRSRQSQPQTHQEHHDYDVTYFADSTVRGVKAKDTDGDGKVDPVTPSTLTPGTVVQAVLVRDKTVAAKDVKDSDLRLKSVAVLGHNPAYKADATAPAAPKKK